MTRSKNKVLLLVIAILLISNIVLLAFLFGSKEAPKTPPQARPGGGLSEYLKKDVGFSDQQVAQYDQMKKDHRSKMHPIFEDLRNTKLQFYLKLKDSTVVGDSIFSAARIIGEKQTNLDVQIFNHFRNVRSICTPEQQVKFDSIYPSIIKKMTEGPRRNAERRSDSTNTADKRK